MENEILFVNAKNIYSKSKDKNYYRISYLLGQESIVDFVEKEEFEKIVSKKPEFLKKYTGIFKINEYKKAVIKDIK